MEIRAAEPRDIDTLIQFNINLAFESEGKILSHEIAKKGINTLIDNPSKGVFYVAVISEEIVGSLMVNLQWVDLKAVYIYYIQSVYTKPEYRGRGVFKSLHAHALNISQANGVALRVYADNDNARAIEVYKRTGMKESNYKMLTIDFGFK